MGGKLTKSTEKIMKQALINALIETLGVVTSACEIAKVSRGHYYNWMRNDDAFARAVEEVGEIALDFAESALHKQIKEGVVSSTIWYLKTKGKKRGYVEKIEHSHDNKKEVQVVLEDKGIPAWIDVPEPVVIEIEQNAESKA